MVTAPHWGPTTYLFFSCLFCSLPDSDIVRLSMAKNFGSSSWVVVAADMVQVLFRGVFRLSSILILASVNAGTQEIDRQTRQAVTPQSWKIFRSWNKCNVVITLIRRRWAMRPAARECDLSNGGWEEARKQAGEQATCLSHRLTEGGGCRVVYQQSLDHYWWLHMSTDRPAE